MQIFILRHGIAEDVPKGGGGDEKRALTPEGRKKMEEAARGFERLNYKIDTICSSPLVRARQTAEIMAKTLKISEVKEMTELAPGYEPEDVLGRLQKSGNLQSVILSGHEPNCSDLTSFLISSSGTAALQFKKGGMALVEIESLAAGQGVLVWLLTPHALRVLGSV